MNSFKILDLNGCDPQDDTWAGYWSEIRDRKRKTEIKIEIPFSQLKNQIESGILTHIAVMLSTGKEIEVMLFGKGHPLLCLPGLGLTAPIWIRQIQELSRSFQIIIIHMPGHGLSDITKDLSYNGVCRVLNEVLSILNIKEVNLMGACLGGLFALKFAALYPAITSSIVLIGTIYDWDSIVSDKRPMTREKVKEFMNFLYDLDMRATEDFNSSVRAMINAHSKVIDEHLQDMSKCIKPNAYLSYFLDMLRDDRINPLLPDIKKPVLVIAGSRDKVVCHENTIKFHRQIHGSEFFKIEGAGHFPYVTHASIFNNRVSEFLNRLL